MTKKSFAVLYSFLPDLQDKRQQLLTSNSTRGQISICSTSQSMFGSFASWLVPLVISYLRCTYMALQECGFTMQLSDYVLHSPPKRFLFKCRTSYLLQVLWPHQACFQVMDQLDSLTTMLPSLTTKQLQTRLITCITHFTLTLETTLALA